MTTLQNRPPTAEPRGSSESSTRMRRDLGTVGLLFAGVASIIGSGWLFGALNASQIAGPAAIFETRFAECWEPCEHRRVPVRQSYEFYFGYRSSVPVVSG